MDKQLISLVDKKSFNKAIPYSLRIPSDYFYNNQPAIKFQQNILSLNNSANYLVPTFEANKISIFSIRGLFVKVG